MYSGYLSLGGTEIVNEQRTVAYIKNLAPRLGLTSECCDCDTIADVLGDAPYSTPLTDEPSWFSAFRQESTEFLGLLPLDFSGFDDSSRTVPLTEQVGDGAVAGRARLQGKALRVRALMVATSEKGLDYGMEWLRDALAGSQCAEGDCQGDDLCYLSACPDLCEDDLAETILDLDYSGGATPAFAWTSSNGLAPVSTVTGLRWQPVPRGWSVSGIIDGLTPGGTYRVDLTMPSQGGAPESRTTRVDIVGLDSGITARPLPVDPSGPDTGGAVFEFVAAYPTHRLLITPTIADGSIPDLEIQALSVTRVPKASIILTTTPVPALPGQQYAWQFPAAAVTNVTTAWTAPHRFGFTSTGTYSAPSHSLHTRRRLTGLTPGTRYRIRTYVAALSAGGATSAVSIVTGATYTHAAPGWITHEFTATDQSVEVQIGNADAFAGGSGMSFSVSPYYLRLEEVTSGVIEPVVEYGSTSRIYRQVSVTEGPVIMEVFPSRQGHYIQRVEWSMGVGVPRPQAPAILVTSSLGPGGSVTPNVECVNGQAQVTNMVTNPSFETGTASWAATSTGGGTVGLTNPVSSSATSGTRVAQMTLTSAPGTYAELSLTALALTSRMLHTLSADLRSNDLVYAQLIVQNSGGTWSHPGPLIELVPNAPMRRVALTFAPPPYVAGPYVMRLRLLGTASPDPAHVPASGTYLQVDRVMLTNRPYDGVYVDGSVPGGVWNGTANASTSTWTNPVASIVIDPDCPPPPAPPRPPIVTNDCVAPSATWMRHYIEIPARVTQQGVVSYPVATLATGPLDARGVRVRVAANPTSRAPQDLDPCDYCGEFVLSYLPANSMLTVDAGTRQVTVVSPAGSTSGRHLLYGSDGGPVTWPEMACGTPYVLVVDLDTATDPLVNLSVSVVPAF